jgi:hypothetical protein
MKAQLTAQPRGVHTPTMRRVRYLLRPVTVWLRYWPQLVACYLLGLLGRRAAIELAAWAGHDNDLWASLIMPLAGLARLTSYVAMFLVLRPAIPVFATLPPRSLRRIDVFPTVIVPFFAIYLAWQMFREDWLAFEARALPYRAGAAMASAAPTELHPDSLPVGGVTWALIVAALASRYVLGWLKDRLPGWMIAFRVYIDALWVFLVLSFSVNQGLTILLNPAGWVAERRIVVWFNSTRAELFSHFQLLETGWNAVTLALRTVFGGAAVPLIWLAVAGIVYGVSASADWRATARRVAGESAAALIDRTATTRQRLRTGWRRVPGRLRDKVREHAVSQLGKFKPIVDSARIILQAGLLALSLYVLAYLGLAWLDMSGSFYRAQLGSGYLFRAMAWLLGPHPLAFWDGVSGALALVSHLIVEPLRICLIATTLAYCLEHLTEPSPEPTTATAAGSTRPPS